MTAHATHQMHAHSLEAYADSDFGDRERMIITLLRGRIMPLSDREIAEYLGFPDMNAIRPRVTDLIRQGVLAESLPVKCHITGRKVRTVWLMAKVRA